MDRGILAALRLLPNHKKSIQELMLRNENFRALCADLAEAEFALERWENSKFPEKEAHCAEYRLIIIGLEAEIRQTIRDR
ncbi:hypothetical protein [Bosea sp. Root483D1]|uniref:hypothetical protein n=1 Tax=Bosea sp. Root483D1 TaxID=1736544 RepID=UPI000A530633|nr:hypothetical protein [Bosea sp. Root483D1]